MEHINILRKGFFMSTPESQINPQKATVLSPLEEMLKKFETENKNVKSAKELRALIESSPALKKRLEDAISRGEIKEFTLLSESDKNEKKFAGGYDFKTKELKIDIDLLKDSAKSDVGKNDLFCMLTHEVKHAATRDELAKSMQPSIDTINTLSYDKTEKIHDYTKAVGDFVDAARRNEAAAQIEAFNALAERVKEKNPNATLRDLYEASPRNMSYFINEDNSYDPPRYSMKANLDYDKNTLKLNMPSEDNVKAAGKYYFDENKDFDYKHYYAAPIIRAIVEQEKLAQSELSAKDKNYVPPEVRFNLKELGIKEKNVENKIWLTGNEPFPYVDGSDGKNEKHKLEPGLKEPRVSQAPKLGAMAMLESFDGFQSDRFAYGNGSYSGGFGQGPMNDAMKTLRPLIEPHLAQLGLTDRIERENLAGMAASTAILGGIKTAEVVALSRDSKTLFVMDGTNEYSNRVAVNVADGIKQPLSQSVAQVERDSTMQARTATPAESVEQNGRNQRLI